MGGYERTPAPWGLDGIPRDFTHKLLAPDWERFADMMEQATARVPAIGRAEVITLINGPEAFTPDGEFILGEAPDVRGFFVAAGFCAHGIAGAGGSARSWPSGSSKDAPRSTYGGWISAASALTTRTAATRAPRRRDYSTYYDIHYPGEERKAGRGLKRSPAHVRIEARSAPPSVRRRVGSARTGSSRTRESRRAPGRRAAGRRATGRPRSKPSTVRAREGAALFDETSFSKLEVTGGGALDLLQRLADNDVDKPSARSPTRSS
jgi:4-methylaminobutanoate oxidase (formaldehyde-forming)